MAEEEVLKLPPPGETVEDIEVEQKVIDNEDVTAEGEITIPLNTEEREGIPLNTDEKKSIPLNTEEKQDIPLNTEEKQDIPLNTEEKQDIPLNTEEKEGIALNTEDNKPIEPTELQNQDEIKPIEDIEQIIEEQPIIIEETLVMEEEIQIVDEQPIVQFTEMATTEIITTGDVPLTDDEKEIVDSKVDDLVLMDIDTYNTEPLEYVETVDKQIEELIDDITSVVQEPLDDHISVVAPEETVESICSREVSKMVENAMDFPEIVTEIKTSLGDIISKATAGRISHDSGTSYATRSYLETYSREVQYFKMKSEGKIEDDEEMAELICLQILDGIIDDVVKSEMGEEEFELEEEELEIPWMPSEERFLCQDYEDPEEVAKDIIEKTCDDAVDIIEHKSDMLRELNITVSDFKITTPVQTESDPSQKQYGVEVFERYVEEFAWPTIEEFTIELGNSKVYDFLESWYVHEDWLFCVKTLGCQSDQVIDYYFYEALWSIPTNTYPIPQATASVFFTLSVSRIVPKTCKVKVTYQFEATRYVHKPGKIDFQEDWLFYIIDSKINLFKQLDF